MDLYRGGSRVDYDEYKDFFSEEFSGETLLTRVNELYNLTRDLYNIDINNSNRDNIIVQSINKYFLELGIWDNSVLSFIRSPFGQKLSNQRLEEFQASPFGKNAVKSTIEKMYSIDIEDRDELIVNEMFLSNRMAKIPGLLMDRMGWSKEKRENLADAFALYMRKTQGKDWNFLENVEFEQGKNNPIVKRKDENYFRFIHKDFVDIKNNLGVDITPLDFYLFARLNFCESFFYKVKIEKVIEAIEKDGLRVKDYSQFDESRDRNLVLLKIDLPGYMHPFIVHIKKNEFRNITGKTLADFKLKKEGKKFPFFPKINFRITKEQEEILKRIRGEEQENSAYQYAMKSLKNLRRKIKYLPKRKRKKDVEETEKISIDDIKDEQISTDVEVETEQNEEQKSLLTNDEINVKMLKYFKKLLESNEVQSETQEEYEKSLINVSRTSVIPLGRVYSRIKDFLTKKNKEENMGFSSEELENEIANLYIYMKICKKGFWTCVYDKNDDKILKAAYQKYKESFPIFIEAIKSGKVGVDEINKYINSSNKKKISKDSSKTDKKYTTKRKKAIKENEQNVEELGKQIEEKQKEQIEDTPDSELDIQEPTLEEEDTYTQKDKNSKLHTISGLQDTLIKLQGELLDIIAETKKLEKVAKGKEEELSELSEKIRGETEEIAKLIEQIGKEKGK